MQTVYGILGLAVLIGIGIVWYKIKAIIWKNINQKLFYRAEHKEAEQLQKPISFISDLSAEEIMNALKGHITIGVPQAVKPAIYCIGEDNNTVTYACGNKVFPRQFIVKISLLDKTEHTEVDFQITNWTESDGMVQRQDEMRNIRKQFITAMEALSAVQK